MFGCWLCCNLILTDKLGHTSLFVNSTLEIDKKAEKFGRIDVSVARLGMPLKYTSN